MNDEILKQKILEILLEGNDIKKHALLVRLDVPIKQERKVRKLVEELVFENELIGSSASRGFFLIKSDKDLKDATKELRDKMKTLAVRANVLVRSFRGEDDPQLKFLI